MKYFKAALLFALITLISVIPCFTRTTASADVKLYAYAEEAGKTYFCADKKLETALFAIPETYCAEIIGEEGEWYKVTYARDEGSYRALRGFVLKNSVLVSETAPHNTYLNMTITVVYRTDSATGSLPALGEIEVSAAYYGEYKAGQTAYSYVYCSESFGYVPQTVTDFPLNELPKKTPVTVPEETDGAARLITALAVTAAAAAAVIIIFVTGKNKVPKLKNASVNER